MQKNITKTALFQAQNIAGAVFSALATARVAFEAFRGSKRARTLCRVILAALAMTLWTLVTVRVAHHQTEKRFEEWCERYVNDFQAQQEAAERGFPPDPKAQLREQTITAIGQTIEGLKLYNYGLDDFKTLLVGADNRRRNSQYPDTLIEVLSQKGQFPGFSDANEVTAKTYATAEKLLEWLEAQERPLCSSDFVYASFEREGVVLRDTWEITTKTHFWRLEE